MDYVTMATLLFPVLFNPAAKINYDSPMHIA